MTFSKKQGPPLYDENDDVVVLDADNFEKEVLNSNSSWIVNFYSRWCGHCKEFAPTYKKLATDMKGWNKIVKLGSVDCATKSKKGKDNGMSICFKNPYFIGGMPDCRFFPPSSGASFKGVQRKFLGRKVYGKDGKLTENSDSYEKVLNDFLNLLQDNHLKTKGPSLEFLKKKQMEDFIKNSKVFTILIEPRNSVLGKLITLDVAFQNIKVGRVSNRNKKAINHLAKMFTVDIKTNEPACALLVDSGKTELFRLEHNEEDFRREVVSKINEMLENNVEREENGRTTYKEVVMMCELETALHYAFRKEVAGNEIIQNKDLENLKDFVNLLSQFFPGRKSTMKFIRKIRKLIINKNKIKWAEWQQILDRAGKTDGSFLSSDEVYEQCSDFPCCLWQVFHAIMAKYHRTAPDMDPFYILKGINGYIESFFTCRECKLNWSYETEDIKNFVDDSLSSMLYIWKKHNSVNRRLKKQPWPSKKICPNCLNGEIFNLDEVGKFLVNFYNYDQISLEGVQEKDDKIEDNTKNDQGSGEHHQKDEL